MDYVSEAETDDGSIAEEPKPKKKIGVKKAAKLQAKAEKRAAREEMLREREEKKQEQEKLDELRREQEEKERKEEEEREEKERLEKEEQAKKEHEAYLELAATFEVEEEGFDEEKDAADGEDKLKQFIDYINEQKVVLLEQLAANFSMRTKDAVDRIQKLVADGQLVGIIDDRGKFISITHSELESVAKFIRQRGRVAVDELVVNSNRLINLKPDVKVT